MTTFRNAVFQLHWFFGITAGLVLALVGVTGAMLSFEDAILERLNPGVLTVEPRGQPLAPAALLARIREQRADAALQSLTLSADPRAPASVSFAAPDGGRRGERRQVDPYTGALLPHPRGEGFFRTTMQLHRWLVMEDIGKQVVAASTLALVFFCLSGLYLRWPRRWGSLRTWLALDWRQKGRNFLWHLHSVAGTWVLVAYLLMALTGLWWSYGWYRDAVDAWTAPARDRVEAAVATDAGPPPAFDPARAWAAFARVAPPWSSATLSWPKGDAPIEVRYLDRDPAHERARNELTFDRRTLAVLGHHRYAEAPLRERIGASIFALHRGSYFGTAGVVVFMLASLLMPLFAITGWMLYLDRRRKQRAARALARATAGALPAPTAQGEADAAVLVVHASQTGSAERLAWQTAAALREGGVAVRVRPLAQLQPAELARPGRMLFVVSTFGEGQAPDSARAFARRLCAEAPDLSGLHYAVLALGDREYGDRFCGFGRALDHGLHHAGAQPLFDRIEVDAGDTGALRHWQHHVGQLAGRCDLPDWSAPDYRPWRLVERERLNPDSEGGATFHLALAPQDPGDLAWQAGDIAEVGPRHGAGAVAAWLAAVRVDGAARVGGHGGETLAARVARSRLPDPTTLRGRPPQAIADALEPLPHREYSIASLPVDGTLQLLVRRMHDADGTPGIGSGWLTGHAPLGAAIDLRIRSNPAFHAPADARPLLLVGNGTGLAGLRAVLKARIAAGHRRNWLVFGERHADRDLYYRDELAAWLRDGSLERIDLAFSREQQAADGQRRYVQHVLREQSEEVGRWLDAGASVYVCGSLEGMAPGVDAALAAIVGHDALEAMAAEGRYRRDVY